MSNKKEEIEVVEMTEEEMSEEENGKEEETEEIEEEEEEQDQDQDDDEEEEQPKPTSKKESKQEKRKSLKTGPEQYGIPSFPPIKVLDPFDYVKKQSVEIGKRKKKQTSTNPIRNVMAQDGLVQYELQRPHVLTLYDNIADAAKRFGDKPAFGWREQHTVGGESKWGEYKWITYGNFFDRAKKFGAGLVHLGLKRGDFVGLYSKNRTEWVLAQSGADSQSMPTVALYDTFGKEIIAYCIGHAELKVIVCSKENVSKVMEAAPKCPKLKYVIQMEQEIDVQWSEPKSPKSKKSASSSNLNKPRVMSIESVISLGAQNFVEPNPPKPNDLALIMYTSGTTNLPKGVMHVHKAFAAAIAALEPHYGKVGPGDRYLSYLPLAHIYERVIQATYLSQGVGVGFYSGDPKRLTEDAQMLKPTLFNGVPRVFDKIFNDAQAKVASAGKISRTLFAKAFDAKLKLIRSPDLLFAQAEQQPKLWNKLVFKKTKAALGGQVRKMVSGSAPLNPQVHEFTKVCFGSPVYQGYGLTETLACGTISAADDPKVGHVGPPLVNTEIMLVDVPELDYLSSRNPPEGEIWIRGPTISTGYYKDEAQTKEAFDEDGWFHTGDIGRWNPDGTFSIIDRKKNIFKLAHGEYVAAEKLEVAYKSSIVQSIFVYGDSFTPSLIALVIPDRNRAIRWAKENGVTVDGNIDTARSQLCKNDNFRKYVKAELEATHKSQGLNAIEKIANISLVDEDWLPDVGVAKDNDLMTPTFKYKRNKMAAYYKDLIAKTYSEIGINLDAARGNTTQTASKPAAKSTPKKQTPAPAVVAAAVPEPKRTPSKQQIDTTRTEEFSKDTVPAKKQAKKKFTTEESSTNLKSSGNKKVESEIENGNGVVENEEEEPVQEKPKKKKKAKKIVQEEEEETA